MGNGYDESKWVAERLLQLAAEQTSLRPIIVRAGQVCGSSNGHWEATEWLPCVLRSATLVKCLPDSPIVCDFRPGPVSNSLTDNIQNADWVPLEVAGSAIAEIRNTSSSIVHITHPKPVSWRYVFCRVSQTLGVPVVPFHDWLGRLEPLAATSKDKETLAVALLDNYRTVNSSATKIFPRTSNENALRESPTLAAARPLAEKDIDSWLSYWKSASLVSF